MNEIVILSGKGGTGKTSIAASLAMIASKEVVVADCDVDAANMHLLLEPDFALSEDFYSGLLPNINENTCNLCGKCIDICRFEALTLDETKCSVNDVKCEGCGYCEKICPEKAINMQIRMSGKVYISSIKAGATMVHARLEPGGENSGKLVAKVKNEARKLLQLQEKKYVLVDGSPGIGCPVVSSLSGASIVLLVTEPSISALNDMKRLHQLLENFKIPAACVINKSDLDLISVNEIKKFLNNKNIPLIAEISFNQAFTDAMVSGKTVAEYNVKMKELSIDIWNKLKKLITKLKKYKL